MSVRLLAALLLLAGGLASLPDAAAACELQTYIFEPPYYGAGATYQGPNCATPFYVDAIAVDDGPHPSVTGAGVHFGICQRSCTDLWVEAAVFTDTATEPDACVLVLVLIFGEIVCTSDL